MKTFLKVMVATWLFSNIASAAPRVVTDIAPVHSLVAQVMEGVGEPELLLPPSASPHDYALRPSDARKLGSADAVIWIGHRLTPWLGKPIETLADGSTVVELLDSEGLVLLEYGGHGHKHDEHGDEHATAIHDPHIWLDPVNAKALVSEIADTLELVDAGNASVYRRNETAAHAGLDALIAELEETLDPVRSVPFIVFHDAYGYFEARFGVEAAGAVTLGDADHPGARRISKIRRMIGKTAPVCAFTEPQFPERTVDMVLNGFATKRGQLDPLGAGLDAGPALYAAMMRGMAKSLRDCLAP